jgi:hypothetical protein
MPAISGGDKMNYVVFGPGRTGSQLIASALGAELKTHTIYYTPYSLPPHDAIYRLHSFVLHTHNLDAGLDLPTKNSCTAIISNRINEYAGAISHFTSLYTKNYSSYSSKTTAPGVVDPEVFKQVVLERRQHYNLINLEGYAKIVNINYEDMVTNPYYLFQQLDIPNTKMKYLTQKSPYGSTLIQNAVQLYGVYQGIK